jgi:hypothetical protein
VYGIGCVAIRSVFFSEQPTPFFLYKIYTFFFLLRQGFFLNLHNEYIHSIFFFVVNLYSKTHPLSEFFSRPG